MLFTFFWVEERWLSLGGFGGVVVGLYYILVGRGTGVKLDTILICFSVFQRTEQYRFEALPQKTSHHRHQATHAIKG